MNWLVLIKKELRAGVAFGVGVVGAQRKIFPFRLILGLGEII